MIVRDDVQRHSHPARAVHPAQQGPEELPDKEDVAGLSVALRVGKVDEPVVVRVHRAAVWAADALRSTGRSRAAKSTSAVRGVGAVSSVLQFHTIHADLLCHPQI